MKHAAIAALVTVSALSLAAAPLTADAAEAWAARLAETTSTLDGSVQPYWFWAPENASKENVPLVVGLHTWSGELKYKDHYAPALSYAMKHGWAFVGPNFRGPNKTPEACGSDLAVQDVVDAVEAACRSVMVDRSRIYVLGASGGGHMALLLRGRHPGLFAAVVAFCPISDLARWWGDSRESHPGRNKAYADMLESSCGGTPSERAGEYARRSPLTWLSKPSVAAARVPTYICTGIHDGWRGSVPVGHAIRAYNALASAKDRVSEDDISFIEANQAVPPALEFKGEDAFFPESLRIHMRKTSRAVRLTVFEGAHDGNYAAGFDFLSRQRKGRAPDWTIPSDATGSVEAIAK